MDEFTHGPQAGNSDRVEALVRAALWTHQWKRSNGAIEFGSLKWRPHLISASGSRHALLHVQLTDTLQPYLVDRLRAAYFAGWEIHLGAEVGSLHAAGFVSGLAGIDVTIHTPNGDGRLKDGRDLLALLGEHAVALPKQITSSLALSAWNRRNDGTKHRRGRRLEGLLAFLFGQVAGLRVVELNLRTATEEIDLVLQTDRSVDASWYESGVPFVLVESKNWSSTVGSSELSSFLVKVQYKRGRCRIGIMCAAGGFSPEARSQELRLSSTNLTIVMMGPDMVEEWIKSDNLTHWLDRCVRRAMLR